MMAAPCSVCGTRISQGAVLCCAVLCCATTVADFGIAEIMETMATRASANGASGAAGE
jgi:hypothetical protein